MKIKFEFYNPNDMSLIEIITTNWVSWNQVMKFGEIHSQSLMIALNLNSVVWDYIVLDKNA